MKTMNLLLAIVATFVMSANANAEPSNKKNSPSAVTVSQLSQKSRQTVIVKGEYKIVYESDAMGRVLSKMILRRDADNWTPVGVYTVNFGEKHNTLTYAKWNSKSHVFNRDAKQTHYDAQQFPLLIVKP